jgi:hypothetical protein
MGIRFYSERNEGLIEYDKNENHHAPNIPYFPIPLFPHYPPSSE